MAIKDYLDAESTAYADTIIAVDGGLNWDTTAPFDSPDEQFGLVAGYRAD